jgi:hypothetical protein
MAYEFTPKIDSTTARECSIVWQVDCGGDGGGGGPGPGGSRVYWGNWSDPLPSSFNEGHFLSPGTGSWAPNAGGFISTTKTTRIGTYEFSVPPAPTNWWQVMWFPNSLLRNIGDPLTATVAGFPFGFQPAPNQPYGTLTIGGVAGKLFVSNGTNNGGFTTAGGNAMQIS